MSSPPLQQQRPPLPAPLWLKITWTTAAVGILAIYWRHYGPVNYLWFSDIALIASVIVLWTGDRLLASTMTVAVLFFEIGWNISYLVGLLTGGWAPFGLASYMFDPQRPLYLRALSLFHVPLPILLVWMVWRMGYDRRALWLQTLIAWIVLPLSAVLSTPQQNVNWTYGPGFTQTWVPQWLWVGALMIGFPLLIYAPTHLLLKRFFPSRSVREGEAPAEPRP